ncbi:putative peroxisomal adenine nucleotide transporter 1 [Rosellinia necatrix]|uniref:Putative peroxisomal adenine nucleotide transporter 1 n=1 Tax=Rosellinia necatrix TaxID=77044 RepID=A0A1W2TNN4_ROSNE|nr:putative peroxisomal adenine nucleotide transporter 1 [Rosellinia necatrix]
MPPSTPSSSSIRDANSALPALHHALSGSLGTLISTCSLYPLSLVVARLQVQRQLRRRSGGRHEDRREEHRGEDQEDHRDGRREEPPHAPARVPSPGPAPPAPALPAPGLQGLSTPPPITPAPTSLPPPPPPGNRLPRKRAGIQETPARDQDREPPRTAREAGIVDAFSQIWSSDGGGGLKAFYTGLAQDAPKSVLDSFLFFLFYEWLRSLRLISRRRAGRAKGRGLGVAEELAVGMAAGACSRAFTTPIANVVTRKQTATLLDPGGAPGVRQIMRNIRREKGIAGFWSGYSATLVLTLNPSLTFFLQEFLKATFAEQAYDDPGTQLTFLFAATSKAISSFITYPFQIAKTRLQAGIPLDLGRSDEDQPAKVHQAHSKPDNGNDDSNDAERGLGNKPKAIRAMQKFAQQSIFGIVAHILRTEGTGSLYDGVGAELLKGFFGHGTTMLAKDVVHKLLFQLYIFALGALFGLRNRRPKNTIIRAALVSISRYRQGIRRQQVR